MPDLPAPAQPGNLRWSLLAVVVLFLLAVLAILVYAPGLFNNGGYSQFVGYLFAVLFVGVGILELAYEAGKHNDRDIEALVPVAFILFGLVLAIATYIAGYFGVSGVSQVIVYTGLLAAIVVGSLLFAVLDRFDATHNLVNPSPGPYRPGTAVASTSNGPEVIVIDKGGGSRILTGIEIVFVIVLMVVLVIAYEDFTAWLSGLQNSCGILNPGRCF